MVKKGLFFSIDALIAVVLILSVIILVPIFTQTEKSTTQPIYFASDIIQVLSTTGLDELTDPAIQALLNTSNISDHNRSILEQVLRFKVQGKDTQAETLLNLTLGSAVPDYYHMGIWVEGYDDPIFATSQAPAQQLISSKQLISGIEKDKVIEGFSSRSFLSSISEQASAVYIYFGGYVGDGNITQLIQLPGDVGNVDAVYIELDAGSDFDITVNGAYAGSYNVSTTNQSNITAGKWQMDESYLTLFDPGNNTLQFSFHNTAQFIGGGYVKISYTSSELMVFSYSGLQKQYLPGISGIINVYDSFYVPGAVNTMDIFLHLTSNSPRSSLTSL